jgi:hypothetical protein
LKPREAVEVSFKYGGEEQSAHDKAALDAVFAKLLKDPPSGRPKQIADVIDAELFQ